MASNASPLRAFRCDDVIWNQFKDYCKANGTDASKVIKHYIESLINPDSGININKSGGIDSKKKSIQIEQDAVYTAIEAVKTESEEKYKHLFERIEALEKNLRIQTDTTQLTK